MKKQFLKVAQEGHFFEQHSRVLVAVSGGKDSMNALHLLYQCREELEIEIGIAHVHHGQRPESDQEEIFLRDLATKWQLPFYVERFSGAFSEARARAFRYDFFERIMRTENWTALVTGHHADDQAETIFMRLLRGSRLLDTGGIKPVQPFAGGELIRPLLSFAKADLAEVVHFEDQTNVQQIYLRNRIRHQYLPLLEQENPQFTSSLRSLGQEVESLKAAFAYLTKDVAVQHLAVFQSYPHSVQTYLLQQYLEQFPDLQLKKQQFQELLALLNTNKTYHHFLKGGYYLHKDKERFELTKFHPKTDVPSASYMVEYGQQITLDGTLFSFGIPVEGFQQCLSLRKDVPVFLRHRQSGDKLLLNGHHKKVRRYFIDQKIPQDIRRQALLVEQEGKIYGIAHMVTSDLSKFHNHGIMEATLYIKK